MTLQSPVQDVLVGLRRLSVFPRGCHFIPKAKLVFLVTTSVIHQELRYQGLEAEVNTSLVEWIQTSSLLLFCILVKAEAVQLVLDLQRGEITDSDLPFESHHRNGNRSLHMASRPDQAISTTILTPGMIQSVLESQWVFLSPVFDGFGRHHDLDDRAILPIVREDELYKVADSSRIARVQVDDDHFAISMPEPPQSNAVALHQATSQHHPATLCTVKRLRSRRDFDAERGALFACNLRSHLHIVTLLATFTWRGFHYLMLPCAVYDLQQLWMREDAQGPDTTQWAYQQMQGLASAINTIHRKLTCSGKAMFGIHGDVKAGNVLVFRQKYDRPGFGVLKLADFSTSAFRDGKERPISFARADPIGTYQPPECCLGHERTQEFDMWGFGCLLLEFAIWLQYSKNGLFQFSRARMQEDHGYGVGFRNDYFFELASPRECGYVPIRTITEINAGVTDYIARMRRDMQPSTPLAMLLNVVEENLLRIDPGQRCTSEQLELAFARETFSKMTVSSMTEMAGNEGNELSMDVE